MRRPIGQCQWPAANQQILKWTAANRRSFEEKDFRPEALRCPRQSVGLQVAIC